MYIFDGRMYIFNLIYLMVENHVNGKFLPVKFYPGIRLPPTNPPWFRVKVGGNLPRKGIFRVTGIWNVESAKNSTCKL